tara:strand:+ start:1073 stop:2371 length:1299 start_codon:yes stop_codon:yes gene_type:complete
MKNLATALILIINVAMANGLDIYVLCEGNFGQNNSTLWRIGVWDETIYGPIYQEITGNELGDVGQSLTLQGSKLYVIMNNSHTIEVLELFNEDEYITTIEIPGASPREMKVVGNTGYVTCWGINGILAIDLNTYTIQDTIQLNGLPEDIVHQGGFLYVSMTMNTDWTSGNQVVVIDINEENPVVSNSFEVVPGPGQMIIHDSQLYVASIYYGWGWYSSAGMSKIDLISGEVLMNDYGQTYDYGVDITYYDSQIYRTFQTGIAPLNEDLSIDTSGIIGNYSNIYSMENGFVVGLSNYAAPDTVVVLPPSSVEETIYQVGAIPGSFAFYNYGLSVDEKNAFPTKITLHQNYPNPFNAETTIQYTLSKQSPVILTIHDLKGRIVRELVNEVQQRGEKSIMWSGRDNAGFPVSSGIYITSLQSGNEKFTNKMLLLK